jgi:hypothetical protein
MADTGLEPRRDALLRTLRRRRLRQGPLPPQSRKDEHLNVTAHIKYVIDPQKIDAFEHYGKRWIELVHRFGGLHHGYFLPSEGANNIAYAMFSFPSLADYERYRGQAAQDPDCQRAYEEAAQSGCVLSYERTFLRPVFE